MAGRTRVVLRADARETILRLAAPALEPAAHAVADALPLGRFPFFRPVVVVTEQDGQPVARVHVGSSMWHWDEYGTRWSAPRRPVQTAVESTGLRYEAKGR